MVPKIYRDLSALGYLFSFLGCAVQFLSMISVGKQTNTLCYTTETNSLCLGLPQANSSLFEPAALVYLSTDSIRNRTVTTGVLGLNGKVELW